MNYNKQWRLSNVDKTKAHNLVYDAKRKGLLVKQPCEKCGNEDTHAHHDDYSKPLEVRWLCHNCHMDHHKKMRKEGKEPSVKSGYKIKRNRHTNPLLDRILKLRSEGKSYNEISSIVGLSYSQCYKLANKTSYN